MNRTKLENEVEQVMLDYTAAIIAYDIPRLKTIFHESALMSGYLGPNLLIGSPQSFYDHLETNPIESEYAALVTEIRVDGRVARVRFVEDNLYGMSFVNEFHLLKNESTWQIVSKLFHHD
jgi:hypothetical protein